MPGIRALPDHLINQIAAGEVVERPAAALKELLENALDSGATQIDVDLAGGGRTRIRVADNGAGIERDELPLAVARHATSKLATVDDLAAIATLGFRGEALASIAAVSRFALASRAAGRPHAWRIEVDGGSVSATEPAALAGGTTVTVQELYYNTPARRKFLRAEGTEWGHCEESFRRIALAHPDVGFTLQHNGRVVFRLLAQGRRARVDALLGEAFAAGAAIVDAQAGPLLVAGLRRPAGVCDAGQRAIRVRQRPLRARPRHRARGARGVPRRAASRPPAGVRAVAHARSAARRRQRPSAEDRGPLSRSPARCTRRSATRSSARWPRPARSSRRCRRPKSWAWPRRERRRSRRSRTCAPADNRGGRVAHGRSPSSGPWRCRRRNRRRSTPRCSARARPAPATARICRSPATTIRWALRWRSCMASTCWRKTAPVWCWSTCTRRTSASSTSGSSPRWRQRVPIQPLLIPATFAASPLEVAAADEHAAHARSPRILDHVARPGHARGARHTRGARRRRRGDARACGARRPRANSAAARC